MAVFQRTVEVTLSGWLNCRPESRGQVGGTFLEDQGLEDAHVVDGAHQGADEDQGRQCRPRTVCTCTSGLQTACGRSQWAWKRCWTALGTKTTYYTFNKKKTLQIIKDGLRVQNTDMFFFDIVFN